MVVPEGDCVDYERDKAFEVAAWDLQAAPVVGAVVLAIGGLVVWKLIQRLSNVMGVPRGD